jgi:ABC-type multidrug transport system fused ATPase/permease subunit
MFKLRFAPYFAQQKKELLAQKEVPHIQLPESVKFSLLSMADLAGKLGNPPLSSPWTAYRLWWESMRAVRPLLLKASWIALLCASAAATSTLAAMQILKTGQTIPHLCGLAGIYFLMNCLNQVGAYHNGRIRVWVALAAETYLVSLIARKLIQLSSSAAMQQSSGNLKVLITSDTKNIGEFLDNLVRNFVPSLGALVVIIPLLFHFTGKAGLFGVLVMMLIIPISLALNVISSHFQDQGQKALDSLTSLLGEWVKNVRLIRYLTWNEAFLEDAAGSLKEFIRASTSQHFMACLIFGLSVCWWMVAILAVLVIARVFHYPLDMVAFFGSMWLLSFLAGYFLHLPNTIRLYGKAAPSMKRIAKLLVEEEQNSFIKPDPDSRSLDKNAKPTHVIFNRVSFQFAQGNPVIQDLSVEIDLAKKLSIVGEVGCGKTTFLKLLCGELPPTGGLIQIKFAHGEVRDLWTQSAYATYRAHLAYVPQEPFISSDLFSTNISLNTTPPEAEIVDAAYWAELEADLKALPNGISQELGESGINLSGGQRQRLNLARARFSNRDYLVLDDTLSAIDTKTEKVLMKRLESRDQGFVLVTHRTGELMRVQEVMVMKEGKFLERGKPQDLAADPTSHFLKVLRAYEEESPHV